MGVVRKRGSVTLKGLNVRLTKFHNKKLLVGVDGEATYPDGTPVAQVAEVQEFGNNHVPPRSFLRTTILEEKQEWLAQMRLGAKLVQEGVEEPEAILSTLGEQVVTDVKNKIKSIQSPPLAGATVAARKRKGQTSGLTKPLIETRELLNSVKYEVSD